VKALTKTKTRSDEELRLALADTLAQQREFRRFHRVIRDDVHAAVDARLVEAGEHANRTLLNVGAGIQQLSVDELLRLHALRQLGADADFAAALHDAIDRCEGIYSELTRAEFDEQLAAFDRKVGQLQDELRANEYARRREALDAQYEVGKVTK
jgi:hypothetical protein